MCSILEGSAPSPPICAIVRCSEDIGAARQNGCPYLLVSKEKASAPNSSISADDKDKIDEGWANLGCNNVTTCQSMTPRPGDNGNDMSQYVPETCKKVWLIQTIVWESMD